MKLFTLQELGVIALVLGLWSLALLNIMDLISNMRLRYEIRAMMRKKGGDVN